MLFHSVVQQRSARMQFIQQFTQETPVTTIHSESPKTLSPVVFEECLLIFHNGLIEQWLKSLAVSSLPCKHGKTYQYCPESGSPLQTREQLALLKC